MSHSWDISKVILLSWRNQVGKLVSGNRVVQLLCGLLGMSLAVLWGFAIGEFIFPVFSSFSASGESFVLIVDLVFTNLSLVAAMFMGFFLLLSPSQTALNNLLAISPVKLKHRTIGYLLPLVAVTLIALAVFYSPIFFSLIFGSSSSLELPAIGLLAYLFAAHCVYAVAMNLVLYLALRTLFLRGLRIGYVFSELMAILIIVCSALVATTITLQQATQPENGTSFNHLTPYTKLIEWLTSGNATAAQYLLIAAVPVTITFLLVALLIGLCSFAVATEKSRRPAFLRVLPYSPSQLLTFISLELKQTARHTENTLFTAFFLLLALGTSGAAMFWSIDPTQYVATLPPLIWIVCALFSHNSYGRTQRSHWLVAALPTDRPRWLVAKVISNLIYSCSLAALIFAILYVGGWQTSASAYVTTLPHGVLLILALTLLGTILPYSEEYPFSSAFSSLFGVVAGIPLAYLSQKAVATLSALDVSYSMPLIFVTAVAGLCVTIYLIDLWRANSDHAL